LLRR
jgi:chaperonin GroES